MTTIMKIKFYFKTFFLIAIMTVAMVALPVLSNAAHYGFVDKFSKALDEQNDTMMKFVIEHNKDQVPAAVRSIIEDVLKPGVPELTDEQRREKLFLAETMAKQYKDLTLDPEPLRETKQTIFELRLNPETRPEATLEATAAVHIVDAVTANTHEHSFVPDNIVIKKGETVRWVNKAETEHLVGSVPFIGKKGIFSPRLKTDETWEREFTETGEYFYICFIHKVMYGKVTVVD